MNFTFLILIALPLGAYLVVILFQTRDIGADESLTEQAAHEIPALSRDAVADSIEPLAASEIVSVEPFDPVIETISPVPSEASVVAAEPAPAVQLDTPTLFQKDESQLRASVAETTATPEAQAETKIPIAETVSPNQDALVNVSETKALEADEPEPILPEGPIQLPEKGSPKYAFDYRGRLWVEKKNKGFFRQLRRPLLPPDDPQNNSNR